MKINYKPISKLPKLAWVSCLDTRKFDSITIFHGLSVECCSKWMVEGVWDGSFESGNFHQSENIFGSGIRVEGEQIFFVTSTGLNDHLMYCFDGSKILVSNSLTVLLGFTGARLDEKHDYHLESSSISNGIRNYKREFLVKHSSIKLFYQIYYENLIVKKEGICFELKKGLHEIASFQEYYDLLWNSLKRIKDNMDDPKRKTSLKAFTTLSTGYDSTAVTCLAKKLGIDTCFTVKKTPTLRIWSSKHTTDDGTKNAQTLGLKIIYSEANKETIGRDEAYFCATNYGKSNNSSVLNEIPFYSMASYIKKNCAAAVVFTGYHGDKVWNIDTDEKFLDDNIKQSNGANIGFCEIRLKSGFINVGVPFILARNIKNIVAISRSDEMKPWSLGNGYDRPIARRIAESSGVERQSFGMQKRGVACIYYRLPKSVVLRRNFIEYLKSNHNLRPRFVYLNHFLNEIGFLWQVVYRNFFSKKRPLRSIIYCPHLDIGFLMWIWSTHYLSKKVGVAFYGSDIDQFKEYNNNIDDLTSLKNFKQNGKIQTNSKNWSIVQP